MPFSIKRCSARSIVRSVCCGWPFAKARRAKLGFFNVLDISAAGMDVQQARLEAAAQNLANSRTTSAPGTPAYQPLSVIVHSVPPADASSQGLPSPVVAQTVPTSVAPHLVYDPGHPDADARGF